MRLVCLCMMHSLIGYSQNVLDSLQLRLNRTDNTSEKILLQVTIAGKLVSSSVDSAINYCYEGLKFSKQIKNDSLEGICYKCLINAYANKPYFEDSALYFVPMFEKIISVNKFYKLSYDGNVTIGSVHLN